MSLWTSIGSIGGALLRNVVAPALGGAISSAVTGAGGGGGGVPSTQVAMPGTGYGGGLPAIYSGGGRLSRFSGRPSKRAAGGLTYSMGGGQLITAQHPGFFGRRRRRRMQVTNTRALRRALRRVEGFERVCKRVLTVTTGHAPRVRFKRRRRRA